MVRDSGEKRGDIERLLAAVCHDGACSSLGRGGRETGVGERRVEGEGRGGREGLERREEGRWWGRGGGKRAICGIQSLLFIRDI